MMEVNKQYTSEFDIFLAKQRMHLPESKSQQLERKKHEQLYQGNQSDPNSDLSDIWEDF